MKTTLQAGGTLTAEHIYVERPADVELLQALQASEFCNVLAPRQIGKSSLRAHCQKILSETGEYSCAAIDLSAIGKAELTIDQWFLGFLEQVSASFRLPLPAKEWRASSDIGPVQRWTKLLRGMIENLPDKIIIFVDEIDTLLTLPSISDDFFSALRALYNNRADDPCCRRLTFCLLGVAAPWELIKNPTQTPYNIGRAIHLEDFSRQDINIFSSFLSCIGGDSTRWLDAIYSWTDGHPFFTQALCMKILELPRMATDSIEKHVERCVWERFLQGGSASDSNLNYAEKRLTHSENKDALLSLYRNLLKTERVLVNPTDLIQFELQLCGLCAQREGGQKQRCLRPRNRIFTTVFNEDWVKGKEVRRFLTDALLRWQDCGKRSDALIQGMDLEDAQKWAQDNTLTREENEFLIASVAYARQEAENKRQASETAREREKREHTERQNRTQRRITYGLITASCAFFLLASLSYWKIRQAVVAEKSIKKYEEAIAVAKSELAKGQTDLAKQIEELNATKTELEEKKKELSEMSIGIAKANNNWRQARNESLATKKSAKQDNEAYKDRIEELSQKLQAEQGDLEKLRNQRTCRDNHIKNEKGATYLRKIQKECP